MAGIYGHRWVSSFGERCDDDDGRFTVPGETWAKGLAGVTAVQLAAGLNEALMSADGWPPTLPDFRGMCLGVPDLVIVEAEIRGGGDLSPFGLAVMRRLDHFRWKQASADTSDKMLRDAYKVAKDAVMRGEPLTGPCEALPAPAPEPFEPATPEQVEERMREIMSVLESVDED